MYNKKKMMSIKERNIRKSVDLMFTGLNDDIMKNIILACALNKSDEEKDAIIEEIKKKQEEDMEYIKAFEIEINKDNHEEMLKLLEPKGEVILTDNDEPQAPR